MRRAENGRPGDRGSRDVRHVDDFYDDRGAHHHHCRTVHIDDVEHRRTIDVNVDDCPTCHHRCSDHCPRGDDDQRCACDLELDLIDAARTIDHAAVIRGCLLGGFHGPSGWVLAVRPRVLGRVGRRLGLGW